MENTNIKKHQAFFKRLLDILLSIFGLLLTFPLFFFGWLLAVFSTRSNGFFLQERIGLYGKPFYIIKLRTMRDLKGVKTNITADNDPRITKCGYFLRKSKLDELPQLINVLKGEMSFVGPRPDVRGYADLLKGKDRLILGIKPGITGPASLFFKNEEKLLAAFDNPLHINDNIIWPSKINLNLNYINSYSLSKDLYYICVTLTGKHKVCQSLHELSQDLQVASN
jgi:lipopolysaccharide/colanic/teichoic acid biosynthesis glycosyltransferase